MLALILFAVVVGYLTLALWISFRFGRSGATPRAKSIRRYGCLVVLLFLPFLDLPVVLLAAPYICGNLPDNAKSPVDIGDGGLYLGDRISPICAKWCTDILWNLNSGPRSRYVEAYLNQPIGFVEMTSASPPGRRVLYRLEVIADEQKCRPDNLRSGRAGKRDVSEIYELYKSDETGALRCISSTPIPARTSKVAFDTRSHLDAYPLLKVARWTTGLIDQNGEFHALTHSASVKGSWIVGKWLPDFSEYGRHRSCRSPDTGYAQLLL